MHSTKQPLNERTSRHVSMIQYNTRHRNWQEGSRKALIMGSVRGNLSTYPKVRSKGCASIGYKSVHNLDRGSCLTCAPLYKRTFTDSVIEMLKSISFCRFDISRVADRCSALRCNESGALPIVREVLSKSSRQRSRLYSLRESRVVIAKSAATNSKISQANIDSSTATETDSDPDGRRFWGLG